MKKVSVIESEESLWNTIIEELTSYENAKIKSFKSIELAVLCKTVSRSGMGNKNFWDAIRKTFNRIDASKMSLKEFLMISNALMKIEKAENQNFDQEVFLQ